MLTDLGALVSSPLFAANAKAMLTTDSRLVPDRCGFAAIDRLQLRVINEVFKSLT